MACWLGGWEGFAVGSSLLVGRGCGLGVGGWEGIVDGRCLMIGKCLEVVC